MDRHDKKKKKERHEEQSIEKNVAAVEVAKLERETNPLKFLSHSAFKIV